MRLTHHRPLQHCIAQVGSLKLNQLQVSSLAGVGEGAGEREVRSRQAGWELMWRSQWGCKVGGKRKWTAAATAALGPAATRAACRLAAVSVDIQQANKRRATDGSRRAAQHSAGGRTRRLAPVKSAPVASAPNSVTPSRLAPLQAATVWRDGSAWAGRVAVVGSSIAVPHRQRIPLPARR